MSIETRAAIQEAQKKVSLYLAARNDALDATRKIYEALDNAKVKGELSPLVYETLWEAIDRAEAHLEGHQFSTPYEFIDGENMQAVRDVFERLVGEAPVPA
jgi:hypothetical protein